MDLSNLKPEARTVEIKHPRTDEPIGIRVTLLPDSDPKVKAVRRKRMDANLASRRNKFTAAQLEAFTTDLLVAAIAGWEWYGKGDDGNGLTFKGAKPEFTDENVRAVVKELDWFRDQLNAELGDDAAFFRGAE